MSEDGVSLPNLRLEAEIGRGGTAIVYRARQLSTGREVAVKVLDADFVRTSEDIDRFVNEAKAAARFRHRNIVRVYDVGQEQGIYYFVMELVEGYTFASYLRRKGQVAVGDVLIILEAVCAALEYAWQKFRVVHCDLKPDNLMVDADGTVKLMDLGISRSLLTAAPRLHQPRPNLRPPRPRLPRRHLRPRRHRLPPPHRHLPLPRQDRPAGRRRPHRPQLRPRPPHTRTLRPPRTRAHAQSHACQRPHFALS